MEEVGTLPERASMGDCARGLQRRRCGLELLSPRSCRSRAYRWGEDGLAGVSDDHQYLCFALALWNGRDSILKERLFGLTNDEGNHGEDVKEHYYYLDSTPTHSYMRMLYQYPQAEFPYKVLIEESCRRGVEDPEFELLDTGVFDGHRYFDITVEYAKAEADDLLIRITIENRANETADLTLLPTLWFRNTWAWGYPNGPMGDVPGKPSMRAEDEMTVAAAHPVMGAYHLRAERACEFLFTENETDAELLYGVPNTAAYTKNAFHRHIIGGDVKAVNPAKTGTKAAFVFRLQVQAGESRVIRLRLAAKHRHLAWDGFDALFEARRAEADAFYANCAQRRDDHRRKAGAAPGAERHAMGQTTLLL